MDIYLRAQESILSDLTTKRAFAMHAILHHVCVA